MTLKESGLEPETLTSTTLSNLFLAEFKPEKSNLVIK